MLLSYDNQGGKQTLQFCIYTVKGYCYATVSRSQQSNKIIFLKILLICWIFYPKIL